MPIVTHFLRNSDEELGLRFLMLSDQSYHYLYRRLYSLASECDMKEKGERIISRNNMIMSSPTPTSALPYLWKEAEAIPDKIQMK